MRSEKEIQEEYSIIKKLAKHETDKFVNEYEKTIILQTLEWVLGLR